MRNQDLTDGWTVEPGASSKAPDSVVAAGAAWSAVLELARTPYAGEVPAQDSLLPGESATFFVRGSGFPEPGDLERALRCANDLVATDT